MTARAFLRSSVKLNPAMVGRVLVLLIVLGLAAWVPAWQRPNFPSPAPRGFGVAIGYGLGGVQELDTLGSVWYLDYGYEGRPLGQHPRLLVVNAGNDLHALRRAAEANRGAWWQFGNEPNDPNQDNVSPVQYARAYQHFYFTLKQIDPAARIVPAGIANADWQWADAFRETYRAAYGRYPSSDGWSIHNYLLDSCADALNVETFKGRVVAFRQWMGQHGLGAEPLFLTEYGVLYGNGCCGCPVIPTAATSQFMRVTSQWLSSSHQATAWAWFAINTHNRFNGDLFTDSTTLTALGQAYHGLIAGATTAPP